MTSSTRRVGRPSTISREEILAVAVGLVQQQGLSALSLRHLARELGVSPTSLYRYFENKHQLFRALAEHALSLNAEALPAELPSEQRLEKLLDQLRAQMLGFPGLLPEFNTSLPAETTVAAIADLAKPIEEMGVDKALAVRHAQSLLWITLGFALFESSLNRSNVDEQFVDLPNSLQATSQHLELGNHDRLWRELVARNIRGIAAA